MTLEEALRAAAAKGMTYLSLYPVESEDRKTTYWRAQSAPSTGHHYVHGVALDPVEAVITVLKALPSAKKRAGGNTVAVTHPPAEGAPLPPGSGPVFAEQPGYVSSQKIIPATEDKTFNAFKV
jgi:hypothetical protein